MPNSSRETFFETFRGFGVLGSVDGGEDPQNILLGNLKVGAAGEVATQLASDCGWKGTKRLSRERGPGLQRKERPALEWE